MKAYRPYFFTLALLAICSATGCESAKSFTNSRYSPPEYAYDSKNIAICGATYKNKDNGALFQDIRRLTLNCDSTFTWKHISCIRRDTSYGRWTFLNNTVYLRTSDKLKKNIAKQNQKEPRDVDCYYIDLTNTALTPGDAFVVWQRSATWTDTLYRR